MSFVWIDESVVMAIHDQQLLAHGGVSGMRDAGLLESALARPLNQAYYGSSSIAECAAAYGYGIVKNHPFVDGNKRTAFVCVELFLVLNGYALTANDAECVDVMLALAASELNETMFATWIHTHIINKLDETSS